MLSRKEKILKQEILKVKLDILKSAMEYLNEITGVHKK